MTWFVTSAYAEDAAPQAAASATATPQAPAAGTVAPSEHGKEPFPPFNVEHFPSQILWFVICFGLLYILMKRALVPRIGEIIDTRASKIGGDIAEAQRLRGQSDAALAGYEAALSSARDKAHKIAQGATDDAKAAADARRAAIEADLSSKLAEAEARISGIKSKALADVGAIAEEAATAVVTALIGTAPAAGEVGEAVRSVSAK